MSEQNRRFFSADSLERAVLDAASHYGVDPEDLAYEPVDKRGLKRRKIVIRVDPESPIKTAGDSEEKQASVDSGPSVSGAASGEAPERGSVPEPEGDEQGLEEESSSQISEPSEPSEPPAEEPNERESDEPVPDEVAASSDRASSEAGRPMEVQLPANVAEWFDLLPEADVEERVAAERWTTALLDLAGLELTPRVRQGEDQLEVSLSGTDAEWLADDDGEVLVAMQHLLPRLMQSDLERLVSCRVDCGGFQLLREERLRARAHWAAEEVRSEGRAVTLEPMPPADRRIIHLALVNDATVDTESLGRGFFKRVSVRPS